MPFPIIDPADLSAKDIYLLLMDINQKCDNLNKKLEKTKNEISDIKTYLIARKYIKH